MSCTQGPWYVNSNNPHYLPYIFADDGRLVGSVSALGNTKDALADAYLIAAAPDLLGACKKAMCFLTILTPKTQAEVLQEIIDDLIAAIAKAEGKI